MENTQNSIRQATQKLEDFETAALPHARDLYRAARSMLGDRPEAEDAVQEMYLRAWKAFDRFIPGTNCRAWLFKILLNLVRNQRSESFRRLVVPKDLFELSDTLVYQPSTPGDLTDEDILAALQQLPPCFAQIVKLVDVDEFSYKEAQQKLGIPIGTVMSRLSRGRRLLRWHLGGSSVAPAGWQVAA